MNTHDTDPDGDDIASSSARSAEGVVSRTGNTLGAQPSRLGADAIPGLAPQRSGGGLSLRRMMAFGLFIASVLAVAGLVGKKLWDKRAEEQVVKAPDVASANADKLRLGDPKGATVPTPAASVPSAALPSQPAEIRLPGTAVPALKTDREPQAIAVIGNNPQPRVASPSNQQGRPAPNPLDAPVFTGQARAAGAAKRDKDSHDDEADAALSRTLASLTQQKAQLEAMLAQHQAGQAAGAQSSPIDTDGLPPGIAGLLTRRGATAPSAGAGSGSRPENSASEAQLLGTLERSATPRVRAQSMVQRTLTLPKGTLFSCALKTRVVTATSGFVGCLVQRDVYGHDGKVVLVERGSHLDGEYRMVAVRPGLTRVPVMWTRVLTPHGISVDLESPATGQLGESGLGGHVDNRWFERIGASLLVSLLDDALQLASQSNSGGSTVYLSSTTAQGSKLAEEVLKSTINIPPLLYANQGGVVGVYVARDLDFSGVYKLQPQ